MIVKLKDLDLIPTSRAGARYPKLKDDICPVLQMLVLPPGSVDYRIVDRNGGISVWPAEIFDIVDNRTPDSWGVTSDAGNCVTIGFTAVAHVGFWEYYYDGAPGIEEVVDQVLKGLR
ncbi:hypothetical protein [Rhodococcus gannanensis]|uniref:Uncharacterized protein n=1 Tax=Rhodococcus gannanensis TaxID=1960308 RepID=A0ABW4P1Z6_9NOCA